MSSRSSVVGGGGAAVPNCACNARTCSESARFSASRRSSRSRIFARSGAVCALKLTGPRHSAASQSAQCHLLCETNAAELVGRMGCPLGQSARVPLDPLFAVTYVGHAQVRGKDALQI